MTTGTILISTNPASAAVAARMAAAMLIICVTCFVARAQARSESGKQPLEQSHGHHQAMARSGTTESGPTWIPDLAVVDQNGKQVRFHSDLVKGKVVVIGFFYTSCTSICPLIGAQFTKLRTSLGDRLGKDVALILVTTDPTTDTPLRLKEWSSKTAIGPQVTLVTGEKAEIDRLLFALNGSLARTGEHDPAILIGSDEAGKWSRTYAFEETAVLTRHIDHMLALKKK